MDTPNSKTDVARIRRKRRHLSAGDLPAASDAQLIYAIAGGQLELGCPLGARDHALALVLWYKDASMVPIYR